MFFLSSTSVFLYNRFAKEAYKPSKKPLFQKRRWSCDFSPRKTPVAQKHSAISRQEKMAFSTLSPVGLSWDSPPPPAETVERTYGRTDGRSRDSYLVTTKISRINRLPIYLLSNGVLLVDFARRLRYNYMNLSYPY